MLASGAVAVTGGPASFEVMIYKQNKDENGNGENLQFSNAIATGGKFV